MNATITFYSIDTAIPGGKEFYNLIKQEMRGVGAERFEIYTPVNVVPTDKIEEELEKLYNDFERKNIMSDPIPIDLELEHIFSNQWNAGEYGRIFDWCEFTYENKKMFTGYFLDFDVCVVDKRCAKKCGYCGTVKTEENEKDWNLNYHLACGIEYLEESELFLTKATPIWEDKKSIHKSNSIPARVKKTFWERKSDFISRSFEKKAKDMYESANKEYETALMKRRIFLLLSAILKTIEKEHHIFIKPCETIIYMHKTPYEANLRWMSSDKKLTQKEIQSITETFARHPEFNKEKNCFEFSKFVCDAPVVIAFNGDK